MASSSTWFREGSGQRGYDLLRTRQVGTGVIAGAGAMLALGMNGQDALQFGAIVSLGNALGDAGAVAAGLRLNMAEYNYGADYIDIFDVASGTAASAALFWYLGSTGNNLMMSAGIAGIACGVGPMLMKKASESMASAATTPAA